MASAMGFVSTSLSPEVNIVQSSLSEIHQCRMAALGPRTKWIQTVAASTACLPTTPLSGSTWDCERNTGRSSDRRGSSDRPRKIEHQRGSLIIADHRLGGCGVLAASGRTGKVWNRPRVHEALRCMLLSAVSSRAVRGFSGRCLSKGPAPF